MKTLGIIPSRYGSSRFPGKPLHLLAGKPLVAWVVEAVKKAKTLDDVIVATDDERIVAAVEAHGGRAVMTPSELPSGTDRITCAAGDFADDDILVNIQGDEPLISPDLIDALVGRMKEGTKWDMATAVTPIKSLDDLNAKTVVKVVLDRDDGALYFSRAPIPCDRDHDPDLSSGLWVRHLGIYAYRGAFLKKYIAEKPCALEMTEKLEQLRALWMGAKIAVIRTADEGVGVDTPEDAVRIEALLRARMQQNGQIE
ncbi:MAG: 3-deoxy-manno-octulosonate cytidylyltransferase [Kiritimatiellae bacterium]|nr:3-deoxy-manno-octulosonate cytidylyltransferase [Kiritimatiellia bacterium]